MIEYRAIRPQRLCRGIEYGYVAVCGMQAADAHGFPSGIIQNKFLALGSQAMNAGFTRSRPAIYLHRGMTAVGRN
jgi:hypothetical protein